MADWRDLWLEDHVEPAVIPVRVRRDVETREGVVVEPTQGGEIPHCLSRVEALALGEVIRLLDKAEAENAMLRQALDESTDSTARALVQAAVTLREGRHDG